MATIHIENNAFAHRTTASRELGKYGIERSERKSLIVGDQAPFAIDVKAVNALIKAKKAAEKAANAPIKLTANSVVPVLRAVVMPQSEEVEAVAYDNLTDAEFEQVMRAELAHAQAKAEEAPKPTKVKADRVNGVRRPQKGVCKQIYDIADEILANTGTQPTSALMVATCTALGINKITVYRQFNDWLRYKGLK